jgi:hypothetical protein
MHRKWQLPETIPNPILEYDFHTMKLKELITAAALPPILLALLTLFSINM